MRSVIAGLALAWCAAGCSDDSGATQQVGLDSGARDAGGHADPGDGQVRSDAATPAPGDASLPLDAGLPGSACASTDSFEPNDSSDAATPLTLPIRGPDGGPSFGATITASSPDWFRFVAAKSDPATVTVAYAVAADVSASLSLSIVDALQTEVANDTREREGNAQTLAATFETTAGGSYFIDVENTQDTCIAYSALVDTSVCTDALEDNDAASDAKPLPDTTQQTSVTSLDADFFLLPAADTQCTLRYAVGSGSVQQLLVRAYDASAKLLAEDASPRVDTTQTLRIALSASDSSAYLSVVASDPECTVYTLNCISLVAQRAQEPASQD